MLSTSCFMDNIMFSQAFFDISLCMSYNHLINHTFHSRAFLKHAQCISTYFANPQWLNHLFLVSLIIYQPICCFATYSRGLMLVCRLLVNPLLHTTQPPNHSHLSSPNSQLRCKWLGRWGHVHWVAAENYHITRYMHNINQQNPKKPTGVIFVNENNN